jgi:predicted transcriptional regulator
MAKTFCISREDFDRYTDGIGQVTAIGLKNFNVLERGVSLDSIRQQVGSFNPPQVFLKIASGSALRKVLSSFL